MLGDGVEKVAEYYIYYYYDSIFWWKQTKCMGTKCGNGLL